MTKILIKTLTVLFMLTFIVSCDRPVCKNTNTIFDKYSPDTKEYKDELVIQLAKVDKSKLTYWMDTYQEVNNSKYIYAHIQGDGLCAKIVLTVNGSDKGIDGILKTKGMGYRGAELEDLKFEIKQDSTSTKFVFQEISGIVD
ncbi:MAG: hypothetical protein ABL927_09120 [Bdellovibrionales bacterium]